MEKSWRRRSCVTHIRCLLPLTRESTALSNFGLFYAATAEGPVCLSAVYKSAADLSTSTLITSTVNQPKHTHTQTLFKQTSVYPRLNVSSMNNENNTTLNKTNDFIR